MQIWLFFVCLLEIDMDMYTKQLLYLAIVSEQSVALGTIFFTLCGHTLQEGGKSAFLTLKTSKNCTKGHTYNHLPYLPPVIHSRLSVIASCLQTNSSLLMALYLSTLSGFMVVGI